MRFGIRTGIISPSLSQLSIIAIVTGIAAAHQSAKRAEPDDAVAQ
jgi:hypothetical protein